MTDNGGYQEHQAGDSCGDPQDFFPGHTTVETGLQQHKLQGMSHQGPGRFELACTCRQVLLGMSAFEVIDAYVAHVVNAVAGSR